MKRTIIISDKGGNIKESIQAVTTKTAKWLFYRNMGEVGEVVKLSESKGLIDIIENDNYVKSLMKISLPYNYKVYGYCNLYGFTSEHLYPEVRVDRAEKTAEIFRYQSIYFDNKKGFGINPSAVGTLYGNDLADYMSKTKSAIELVAKLNELWNNDMIKRLPILIDNTL